MAKWQLKFLALGKFLPSAWNFFPSAQPFSRSRAFHLPTQDISSSHAGLKKFILVDNKKYIGENILYGDDNKKYGDENIC